MDYSTKSTIEFSLDEGYLEPVDNFTLWRLFFVAQSAVGRLRDLELAGIGVTPEQSGALFLLSRNKGTATITQMAEAWLRQRNSVSTLIDRMSKQGLVKKTRIPGQKDLQIEITPKGQEYHNRVRNAGQILDIVFGNLTVDERLQFAQHLRSVLVESLKQLEKKHGRKVNSHGLTA